VLANAGYDVSVATVDASSREAVQALVETAIAHGRLDSRRRRIADSSLATRRS
jgi:hypothetical protein